MTKTCDVIDTCTTCSKPRCYNQLRYDTCSNARPPGDDSTLVCHGHLLEERPKENWTTYSIDYTPQGEPVGFHKGDPAVDCIRGHLHCVEHSDHYLVLNNPKHQQLIYICEYCGAAVPQVKDLEERHCNGI